MFWYNGELFQSDTLALSIWDPGLLYGATVFTTMRVYDQSLEHRLTNWIGHCDRIQTTLQDFSWLQPDWQRLRLGAETLLALFPVLRIAVFPDGREWILGRPLPTDLVQQQQQGITAWLADTSSQRALADRKTGNYLAAWLAQQSAKQQGAKESILVDGSGCWLETSTGNLWGWKDGCWWTPPLRGNILPGLTRSQLITWLMEHHQTPIEVPWSAEHVQGFEAIAFTNSVVEVIPIHTILHSPAPSSYNPCHDAFRGLRSLFHGVSD